MKKNDTSQLTVLMADDDEDDRLMTSEALTESQFQGVLYSVDDGEEALNFLRHTGGYSALNAPRPDIVLLDLNMPRKDGREVLREMKADPELRCIPVIILTTSKAEEDILRSYDLGVNSFITKPVTFEGLVNVMRTLGDYWVKTVQLPSSPDR
jgi:CheY-like chemotaxis protein